MRFKNLLLLLLLLLLLHKEVFAMDNITVLARIIFAEAAGENYLGKVAVAWVVKNRVYSKKFPNTYENVIYQPWQFTGVNSLLWKKTFYPKKLNPRELTSWQDAQKIAKEVIEGRISDPTRGADHYYSIIIPIPKWAKKMQKTAKIGKHIFFKSEA